MASDEELKLSAVCVPKNPIEAIQTATINASITAYSTAVGPSSSPRNVRIARRQVVLFIGFGGWEMRSVREETAEIDNLGVVINGSLPRMRPRGAVNRAPAVTTR